MSAFEVAPLFYRQPPQRTAAQWLNCISALYDIDEDEYVTELLGCSLLENQDLQDAIELKTRLLVESIRSGNNSARLGVDQLLQEYSLDNEEGLILMCLAEALLRIPDRATADALIRDKLSGASWDEHIGQSDSFLVNASSWGLFLGQKSLGDHLSSKPDNTASGLLGRLVNKLGEPLVRTALYQSMKMMGEQFVLGRDIAEALKNSRSYSNKGYLCSFDMLGEAALTEADASRYLQAYIDALQSMAADKDAHNNDNSLSIKLSALHPRYEANQSETVLNDLMPGLKALVVQARQEQIPVTIDAEESDRLELSLQIFQALYESEEASGWGGLGMAVQAYSKRAITVLGFLTALAQQQGDIIPVRLVKGAYWDSEIKHAQQLGQANYPVFTRKENTDLSYQICARYLLTPTAQACLYPQFASHNAQTVSSILEMVKHHNQLHPQQELDFEFQRLHGMGEALYDQILSKHPEQKVRIYAPVGAHKELLPYLVRRLLENGANSSFVYRLVDNEVDIETLTTSPLYRILDHANNEGLNHKNPSIPLPVDLFQPQRRNSQGYNLSLNREKNRLTNNVRYYLHAEDNINKKYRWNLGHGENNDQGFSVHSPFNTREVIGCIAWTDAKDAKQALDRADAAWFDWNQTCVEDRASCLERMAELMEKNLGELVTLCAREAGKTWQDGIDEVREAVDFCRYYAYMAGTTMADPTLLPGPTGEKNEHYYAGRGVFLCISPWNFPLAIFTGQVAAALVSGNCVLAKPAEQTSLIAGRAITLFHQAGIPQDVLHFLPGPGALITSSIINDDRLSGIAFTGSTATAHNINQQLANRIGSIIPFIAETGGQNAMIVDSTAQPEQVIQDVIQSAFNSAGQRCSALRLLCLQEEIYDRVIELLKGALEQFVVGNPLSFSTDCGPVIDKEAYDNLSEYIQRWRQQGWILAEAPPTQEKSQGYFISPIVIGLEDLGELGQEQFGPILHVYRYESSELDEVIHSLNRTGYGLTLGIHTRNETTAAYIESRVRVGNCYINRNQVGAVVGSQPFGGRGLSGTGPKAGGPDYLKRFATERVRTTNTSALGGNASLLSEN